MDSFALGALCHAVEVGRIHLFVPYFTPNNFRDGAALKSGI